MNPLDLVLRCKRAIEQGDGRITLVVPGPAPRGEKVKLTRGRGRAPMGEVLSWTEEAGTVAVFEAIDLLAYLAAKGFVDVVTDESAAF